MASWSLQRFVITLIPPAFKVVQSKPDKLVFAREIDISPDRKGLGDLGGKLSRAN